MAKLTPKSITPRTAAPANPPGNPLQKGELDAISQLRLHLSLALQTSLDTQEILKTFATHCDALFGVCGLAFTAADPELNTRIGDTAIHHFNYSLSTAHTDIGELCLYSRKRLSDSEIMLLEIAASCTVYPLQNALQYHSAVVKAHRDPLTALGNRLAMNAAIRREVSRANRHHTPLSILMIDIDLFYRNFSAPSSIEQGLYIDRAIKAQPREVASEFVEYRSLAIKPAVRCPMPRP